jgi:uracil phosphoribosyltransferase
MKVINLGEKNSIMNNFVAQLRDKDVQKDSMRFRRNLERIGEIFAYEISQTMNVSDRSVVTPLGIANVPVYDEKIVLATILRAGLPLHQGLLNYFDDAQNAFVATYRKYHKGEDFNIEVEYATFPDLTGKTLILADTMLATGSSLEVTYKKLCENVQPYYTHLVCPIASAYSVEYLQKHLPEEGITLWVAAIDEELTSRSYIVPGLGDAGDLAFGSKK